MIVLIRSNSENPDFQSLVSHLDEYLRATDGNEHAFYAQFNKTDTIKHVVIAYKELQPVGCGAFREYSKGIAEVKRMFVPAGYRGNGIAGKVLRELEQWAKELNFKNCILETGKNQREAIGLYKKHGYTIIPNYGQYTNVKNSVCMEKQLVTTEEREVV